MKKNNRVFVIRCISCVFLFLNFFISIKSYATAMVTHSVSSAPPVTKSQQEVSSKSNIETSVNAAESIGPVTMIHQILQDLSMAGFKHPTFQFVYFVPSSNKISLAGQLNKQEKKVKNKSNVAKERARSQGSNKALIYFKKPNMKVTCERTVIPTIDARLIAMKTVCSAPGITKPKKSEANNPVRTIIDILNKLSDSEFYSYLLKVGIVTNNTKASLADQFSHQQKVLGFLAFKHHEANGLFVTYDLGKENKLVYCMQTNADKPTKREVSAICTINQDAGDIRHAKRW